MKMDVRGVAGGSVITSFLEGFGVASELCFLGPSYHQLDCLAFHMHIII